MRFFTVELYEQNNNPAFDNVADQLWSQVVEEYSQQLNSLNLSPALSKFNQIVNLHDAKIFYYSEPELAKNRLELNINQNDNSNYLYYLILRYDIAKPVNVIKHTSNFPIFHTLEDNKYAYILYDEISVENEIYVHCLLMSDGTEYQIYFSDFHFVKIFYNKREIVEA